MSITYFYRYTIYNHYYQSLPFHPFASFFFISIITTKTPFQPSLTFYPSPQINIFLPLSFLFRLLQQKPRSSGRFKKHPTCKPTSSCIFSPYIFYCNKKPFPAVVSKNIQSANQHLFAFSFKKAVKSFATSRLISFSVSRFPFRDRCLETAV